MMLNQNHLCFFEASSIMACFRFCLSIIFSTKNVLKTIGRLYNSKKLHCVCSSDIICSIVSYRVFLYSIILSKARKNPKSSGRPADCKNHIRHIDNRTSSRLRDSSFCIPTSSFLCLLLAYLQKSLKCNLYLYFR